MGRKKGSSERWLREHERDAYVQRARREGRIARSAYKLIQIDERDRLLRPGGRVVDLGAAPGGWSAYAAQRVGAKGLVLALDRLPMEPLVGVEIVEGDFCDNAVAAALESQAQGSIDLVMSDMAPNFSGTRAVDQPRAMELAELALYFAESVLRENGDFLVKVFQGEGFDVLLREMRSRFKRVLTRKPDASRARSRELYLLGREFRQS